MRLIHIFDVPVRTLGCSCSQETFKLTGWTGPAKYQNSEICRLVANFLLVEPQIPILAGVGVSVVLSKSSWSLIINIIHLSHTSQETNIQRAVIKPIAI